MKTAKFDNDGSDKVTFAPFVLENLLDSEWKDVRLIFADWDWIEQRYGTDTIDDYYFNGYGVEGLVRAIRLTAGLDPEPDSIHYNSEGDTCFIHFKNLEEAVATADLASNMIQDRNLLANAILVARENGFEDG